MSNLRDNYINPLLNDKYQYTMAYGYFKNGHHLDQAVFEVFFRKNPFKGEFTIFAGINDVIDYINSFKITEDQIDYLKIELGINDDNFFIFLKNMNMKDIKIYACEEGTIVFPKLPVIQVEGPVIHCQLLETTILTLINYASLITTNALRYRLAAGEDKLLLEFGLRRAQGPDGGVSASRYAYMGGFDGTSNMLAGDIYNIPCMGTIAHSYVTSYTGIPDLHNRIFDGEDGVEFCMKILNENHWKTSEGELVAFLSYAFAFPDAFLALVDTYDSIRSGIPNFMAVAYFLHRHGHKPMGIRIDSGDLAYLSRVARQMFRDFDVRYGTVLGGVGVTVSNDINEEVLLSLETQTHEITGFGIGTNLVTCQSQPALGMVYKLVEIGGKSRIKLSEDHEKITIPGSKNVYRIYTKDNPNPKIDVLVGRNETDIPKLGCKYLCRHPNIENKRVYVTPSKIEVLTKLMWDGSQEDPVRTKGPPLSEIRARVKREVALMREDHVRFLNPTPYKVSLSPSLYHYTHQLILTESSVPEI